MQKKEDVNYSKGMPGRRCGNCKFYRSTTSRCIKVAGVIDPEYWCELWRKKQ